jgi:hypothetical protein
MLFGLSVVRRKKPSMPDRQFTAVTEFLHHVVNSSIGLGIHYGLLAGTVWLLGYVIFKRQWFHRKFIAKFPASKHV